MLTTIGTGTAISTRMPTHNLETNDHTPFFHDAEFLDFFEDDEFDKTYPEPIQKLSRCHWTPVEVGRKAAQFLVTEPGTRVLDVGCGPGKFCAIGAVTTEGHFTGIEQRERLVSTAKRMIHSYGIPRVDIIHSNVTELCFKPFDAFYIYNPFQENIFPSLCIDSDVKLQPELYNTYSEYVCAQLSLAPVGTRVATYWGNNIEIPASYDCVETHYNENLKFWTKQRKSLVPTTAMEAIPTAEYDDLSVGAFGLAFG